MKTHSMSVIEKLKEAVRSVVEAERQDLYAEARLNDGRVIATEAEAFSAGAPVRVLSEDGDATPLDAGSYELADGGEVTVDENSQVVEMEETEVEAAEHEEEKDEMAAVKAALVDKFQISPEVAEEIVEVVKEAMMPTEEVEAAEEEEEEKTEMSSHLQDLTHEMAVALEAINSRLEKLEAAPATQPDRVLPKFNPVPKAEARGTGLDQALNIINQF